MINRGAIVEWAFYQHPHGGWSWQILGSDARRSDRHFPGMVEAFADAVDHGFRPGISRISGIELCRRSGRR